MNIKNVIHAIEDQKNLHFIEELPKTKYYRVLTFCEKSSIISYKIDHTKKVRVEVFDQKRISSSTSIKNYFYTFYNNVLRMKNSKTNLYVPIDNIYTTEYVAFIYEFPEKGSMLETLTYHKKLNEEQVMMLATEVFQCIESLYKKRIVTKYIPIDSLFVVKNRQRLHIAAYVQKIEEDPDIQETHSDFLIKNIDPKELVLIPPEVFFGKKLTARTSYFCLGMTLYVMLMGTYPFSVKTKDEIILFYENIKDLDLNFGEFQNQYLINFIIALTKIEHVERTNTHVLGEHLKMFEKLYSVQANTCRNSLFQINTKVTDNLRRKTMSRIQSAKISEKRIKSADMRLRVNSLHNEQILRPNSSITYKSLEQSNMKIRNVHKIGQEKDIKKIVQNQIENDMKKREFENKFFTSIYETKKALLSSIITSNQSKPSSKDSTKQDFTINQRAHISRSAFSRAIPGTQDNSINNSINVYDRPMSSFSIKKYAYKHKPQPLSIRRLTMSQLLVPSKFFPKQFKPSFN